MNSAFHPTRRAMLASATAVAVLSATRTYAAAAGEVTPVVRTANGPVRGKMEPGGVYAFKGLRYAAPPTGPLRFRPPQPLPAWSGVADASEFGNAAVQTPGADAPATETHSEDCLFLNVWTNGLRGAKRPVMVWLHGGAFAEGSPARPTYFGDHFARDGVVLVSVTHRLNVFGFTQLPDSWGPDYASSGLAGMLDIVAALHWVKANIAKFGGDPDNVTIFGESGGGAKVSLLLGMPSAKGLYHKAIIQSGAGLDAAPRDYAQALGGALTEILGVKPGDVTALAGIDAQQIFKTQQAAIEKVKDRASRGFLTDGFVPSVDGVELPRGPFTPDAQDMIADVPLIIGTNKDESVLFLGAVPAYKNETEAGFEARVREAYPAQAGRLIGAMRTAYPGYSPGELSIQLATARMFWIDTIKLAERKLKQPAPIWMYRMDWGSPLFKGRAVHAMELSLVFGTYDNIRFFVGPGEPPARLSSQMHPAWVAFAKTGNPQHPAIPVWPRYDANNRETMIFDLVSRVERDPLREIREVMVG